MNAETEIAKAAPAAYENVHLLREAFAGLRPLVDELRELSEQIGALSELGDEATRKTMRRLRHQLSTLEPAVTMIGQVKAGKTTLVNALAGWPGLLPADVNPWTSVVTSLHFDPHSPKDETRASFRFFENEEWDWLINRGGRIGELAERAGAGEEMEKVRQQVEEMREKSRRRLGRKFELLLGQKHDYGYFDSDLVERYVCLGDDFDEAPGVASKQGRFADITKSADLYLSRPEFPMRLCIRDTPGVNDTFMMREQITIRATRDSRICVLVLSAHQALSTVDMALIRLISNVKARDVIIFVNRIDELSDPGTQLPEISAAIERTLVEHQGPKDAQIIFGSGYWANAALTGEVSELDKASGDALLNMAEAYGEVAETAESTEHLIWQLSGVPALCEALSERILDGIGHETTQSVARSAMNHAKGLQASEKVVELKASGRDMTDVDPALVSAELDKIEATALRDIALAFDETVGDFDRRLERAHRSFLERATASLVDHLEKQGENATWQYDPTGLRVLLRSAYRVFTTNARRATEAVMTDAATAISALYGEIMDDENGFGIQTPEPPRAPPPVLLGQTIALDVKGSFWTRWWRRRRGPRAYAAEFAELIKAETDPIVTSLREAHAGEIRDATFSSMQEFLADQRAILMNIVSAGGEAGSVATPERQANLDATLDRLSNFAA